MLASNTLTSVLIVDDDLEIREALTDLLSDSGYGVISASNGAEALKLLRTLGTHPAMILLDLMMPVMDGYAFLEARRNDPALSAIPVAVITAGHGVDQARLGASLPILPKPIDVPKMMATLEEVQASGRAP